MGDGTDVPEYMELAVHRISWSWSSVMMSSATSVSSNEKEKSRSLEDPSSSVVVVESKDASKGEEECLGSSRRVDTKDGRAVPFFCGSVNF